MNSFASFQTSRLKRIRGMTPAHIITKLKGKFINYFSFRINIRRVAFYLNQYSLRLFVDDYQERKEIGPVNFDSKLRRQAEGGPFEPPIIVLTNRVAAQLVREQKNILEIGCGTGMFSYEMSQDSSRRIVASEFDEGARNWARMHRSAPNIEYCELALEEITANSFDIAVAIEVIEHLDDFPLFLKQLGQVANTAIISTPNKHRSPFDSIANTPAYEEHVREWSAGEFYWVLKCFYKQVDIYTIPKLKQELFRYKQDSSIIPSFSHCGVLCSSEVLVAYCSQPK